jgi:hypothetical protein
MKSELSRPFHHGKGVSWTDGTATLIEFFGWHLMKVPHPSVHETPIGAKGRKLPEIPFHGTPSRLSVSAAGLLTGNNEGKARRF